MFFVSLYDEVSFILLLIYLGYFICSSDCYINLLYILVKVVCVSYFVILDFVIFWNYICMIFFIIFSENN